VTSISEEEIQHQASQGQVPKILEFTPGAEVTQSGLYDFNFNTRGFNSSLNRRVSTYIDGRDVGVVLLGAQEWSAIAGGLDDVANLEFVRGPSAALYGANASSGVVNITTKAPKESLGGLVRLTGGELSTLGIDYRQAFSMGDEWYMKVVAGGKMSGDYTVSRNPDVVNEPEYSEFCLLVGETDCLPGEKTLFREQDDDILFGALRMDKYLTGDRLLSFEGGISSIKGPVFQTGIGRVQNLESTRPFTRVNYSDTHWNVMAHYSSRDGNQANLTRALIVDYQLITQEERYGVEGQGHWNFGGAKGRVVAGGSYTHESVNSFDEEQGRQTVLWEPKETDREALFGQVDWSFNKYFKVVGAGRVDWSTLHDTQFSPKAAVVYNINPTNSLRLTYNQAFQVANYSEFFLHTNISFFPIGGFVRTICEGPLLEEPVDCGIHTDFIPILAVGNDDLELEETSAWELGYSGLLWSKVFVTLDYYRSNNKNFITDLVPQVGTVLGNTSGCVDSAGNPEDDPRECPINNDYKPWVSTEEAENTILIGNLTVAQALRNAVDNSVGGNTLGFRLAQDLDGASVVVGRTYTNVGQVETQGVDFGMQYFITPAINVQANYSYFDFKIVEAGPGLEGLIDTDDLQEIQDILLPNTPAHKASVAFSMNKQRWNFGVAGRWVKGFRWSAGVFQGDVPNYLTADVWGSYGFNEHWRVGVNVANATNSIHRQTFGGDNISRRALINLTYAW
jgi:outer membrane receptor protein involved in Fe transport